jgi:hypothetical protein
MLRITFFQPVWHKLHGFLSFFHIHLGYRTHIVVWHKVNSVWTNKLTFIHFFCGEMNVSYLWSDASEIPVPLWAICSSTIPWTLSLRLNLHHLTRHPILHQPLVHNQKGMVWQKWVTRMQQFLLWLF